VRESARQVAHLSQWPHLLIFDQCGLMPNGWQPSIARRGPVPHFPIRATFLRLSSKLTTDTTHSLISYFRFFYLWIFLQLPIFLSRPSPVLTTNSRAKDLFP